MPGLGMQSFYAMNVMNAHRAVARSAARTAAAEDVPNGVTYHNNRPALPAHLVPDDLSYKDNIRFLDCNRFWRRLGIPLSNSTCRRLWFVKDCAGVCGCIFTWLLIIFGETLFFLCVLVPFRYPIYSAINAIFSISCAFLGFVAHLRAMFSDPVSRALKTLFKMLRPVGSGI